VFGILELRVGDDRAGVLPGRLPCRQIMPAVEDDRGRGAPVAVGLRDDLIRPITMPDERRGVARYQKTAPQLAAWPEQAAPEAITVLMIPLTCTPAATAAPTGGKSTKSTDPGFSSFWWLANSPTFFTPM